MGMEKYTSNHARFFMCKKYTTISTEVALRSVNNIFPESYDFAVRRDFNCATHAVTQASDFPVSFMKSSLMKCKGVLRAYSDPDPPRIILVGETWKMEREKDSQNFVIHRVDT
jgi:hypothetical protein